MELDALPEEREPYNEGRNAILEKKVPSNCPYLPNPIDRTKNMHGDPVSSDDVVNIELWLEGWSDGFLDAMVKGKEILEKEIGEWGA